MAIQNLKKIVDRGKSWFSYLCNYASQGSKTNAEFVISNHENPFLYDTKMAARKKMTALNRHQNGDELIKLAFFVRLCGDVVKEVFHFGERRRLTKMELVGSRFHWIVENFFSEAPFLQLNLKLLPRYNLCFLFKVLARICGPLTHRGENCCCSTSVSHSLLIGAETMLEIPQKWIQNSNFFDYGAYQHRN